jgi:hypothetical protein
MENKTDKSLTRKFVFCINHNVTTVTAIETDERTANGVARLWERAKAERFAVAMTPFVETERSARESRQTFLSARIKTGSNHQEGPASGELRRLEKSKPRCRNVTGGGGQPPKKTT